MALRVVSLRQLKRGCVGQSVINADRASRRDAAERDYQLGDAAKTCRRALA
jgi:hypothetical protein